MKKVTHASKMRHFNTSAVESYSEPDWQNFEDFDVIVIVRFPVDVGLRTEEKSIRQLSRVGVC